MRVGLVGDLEGSTEAAVAAVRELGERGDVRTAYQLGDLRFGMGTDPDGYLAAIDAACATYDVELVCIGGNHEHWARLDALWADDPTAPLRVAEHVMFVPRGHRWELGGRSFLALGGAPSINRHRLTEGVDWWPTEVLRPEHVDAAVAAGPVDVMLTHDSPGSPWCVPEIEEILRRNVRTNPWAWPPESLAYAEEGLALTTRAVLGVRPRLLAHGHFHVAGEDRVRLTGADHDTTVWALAARGEPGTVRVLDLETLG